MASWRDAPVPQKNNKDCVPGRQHFWEIDLANGPESWGVCKYCQWSRLHKNFIEGTPYNRHPEWKRQEEDILSSVT